MKRRITEQEWSLLLQTMKEAGYKTEETDPREVMINGATVLEISDSPKGKVITYTEDDLTDQEGYIYIFDETYYQYLGYQEKGRRLIAIYIGSEHFLLPINGDTYTFVGTFDRRGDCIYSKDKAMKLPTPLVLNLPKDGIRPIAPSDLTAIKAKIQKSGSMKALSVIGTIALCIAWFIIDGIGFLFTFSALESAGSTAQIISMVIALILLIAGFVGCAMFFKDLYMRNVLKMKYIRKVMLTGINKDVPTTPTIGFYEWVGNEVIYCHLALGVGQIFLPKEVKYGDMAYILSREKADKGKIYNPQVIVAEEYI